MRFGSDAIDSENDLKPEMWGAKGSPATKAQITMTLDRTI
jgi:hypothetical protein